MRNPSRLISFIFLLALSRSAFGVPIPPGAQGRFVTADAAYKLRKDEAQARAALNDYREIFKKHPQDPEAGWRVAMGCYFVGLRLTHAPDQRKALFAEGSEAGKKSIALAPHCAPCYFWTAINMALYGQEVGVLKTLTSLGEIREDLRKSLKIDPTYASSGALRLLGVIDEKLPGIFGGSNQRAKLDYLKAIQLSPDEPLNYLFLARLLDKEFSDRAGAIAIARRGAAIQGIPAERLESIEARAELEKWLRDHLREPALASQ